MKKIIVALLATGLMGSALAQSNPPARQQLPPPAVQPATAAVPGAKTATTQSLGNMTPFAVIGGVVVLGAVIAATGGGSSHSNNNTPTTGTTGTN